MQLFLDTLSEMVNNVASDLGLQFANVPVQILQITLYQQHSDITATRIVWL